MTSRDATSIYCEGMVTVLEIVAAHPQATGAELAVLIKDHLAAVRSHKP